MLIFSKVSQAQAIVPIVEPLITKSTPSFKQVDDKKRKSKPEERAKPILEEQQGVVVSETTSEDRTTDFKTDVTVEHAQVTSEVIETISISEVHTESDVRETKKKRKKVEKLKGVQVREEEEEETKVEKIIEMQKEHLAQEVETIMEMFDAPEFKPGKQPLRELATIGYLLRHGVTVNEINENLYRTDNFPALRTPDAQNALVQLVERKGHGPLITQVLTEETTTDESKVAATVGFRAFIKMIELQHITVEEAVTQFTPEDFRSRPWEVSDVSEVSWKIRSTLVIS